MATIFDATTLPHGVPVGRLVFGDPFTPEKVMDDKTNTQKLNADGTPMFEYVVGVAYSKSDPVFAAFWAYLKQADKAEWPQFHDAQNQVLPGVVFAEKRYDGDGHDKKGQPHSRKEGWAGHWIVKYSTQFAPGCHVWGGASWVPTTDKNAIKRGYYVQVTGSTQTNKSTQSPGMHRNASIVALAGFGAEIVGVAADPNKALGMAPPPLPAGASATPLAPAAPPVTGAAPAAPPVAPAAPAAAPTLAAPPVAPAAPATHTGHMPPAPPAPPAPAFVPGPVMTDKAAGQTREQFHAIGWTDAQLIEHGYMIA